MAEDKDKTTPEEQEALKEHDIYFNPDGSINMDLMSDEDKAYMMSMSQEALATGLDNLTQFLRDFEKQLKVAQEDILNINKAGTWQNEAWQQLCGIFPDADSFLDKILNERGMLGAVLFWIECLYPMVYDIEDLQAYIDKTGFTGTLDDFISRPAADPESTEPVNSPLDEWISGSRYANIEPAEAEAEAETLENFLYSYPTCYVHPSNKITNELASLFNKGPTGVIMGRYKNSKTSITSKVEIKAPKEMNGVAVSQDITEFDLSVFGSVCTIWEAGYDFMTSDMLARVVSANPDVNPKKGFIKAVEDSFTKMRVTDVRYDITDLANSADYEITDPKQHENMIYAKEREMKINGRRVNGYVICEEPVLLHLSKELGQIQTTPIGLREIKEIKADGKPGKTIPATVNRISIRDYLLRTINAIKSDSETAQANYVKYVNRRRKHPELPEKKLSEFRHVYNDNIILYNTIFKACNLEGQSRQTRINNIIYIKQCLDFWIYEDRLKKYREVPGKRRDSARGVQIEL